MSFPVTGSIYSGKGANIIAKLATPESVLTDTFLIRDRKYESSSNSFSSIIRLYVNTSSGLLILSGLNLLLNTLSVLFTSRLTFEGLYFCFISLTNATSSLTISLYFGIFSLVIKVLISFCLNKSSIWLDILLNKLKNK